MSRAQRAAAYPRILTEAIAVSVMWVTSSAIDEASQKGEYDSCHVDLLRNAIGSLTPQPAHVLIDYLEVPGLSMPHQSLLRGDAISATVAAASVVAKVTRDRMMTDFGAYFPGYGFERHKGYGADEHMDALAKHGPCPIHRRSSKGVRPYLDQVRVTKGATSASHPLTKSGSGSLTEVEDGGPVRQQSRPMPNLSRNANG